MARLIYLSQCVLFPDSSQEGKFYVLDRRTFLAGAAVFSTFGLAACAVPISTRGAPVLGSFAWFDLVSDDPAASEAFYSAMFGWRFSGPATYRVISSTGGALGGMTPVADAGVDTTSQWVGILTVEDTLDATQIAQANGARLARQPVQNNSGVFSTIYDNRGALITLYDGNEGFSLSSVGNENAWIWVDLFTDNTSRSRKFYAAVAGLKTEHVDGETYFTRDGQERGGLIRLSGSDPAPNWLPYVGVGNLQAGIDRAVSLGAIQVAANDEAAILVDPTGAGFGIIAVGG